MLTSHQIKQLQKITNPLVKKRYLIYFQLPPGLQQMMFNTEIAGKIKKIAEDNNLNKTQTWSMSYIVGMILLGETNIIDFLKSIEKECKLERESARQLARDINSEIFLPVKDDLKIIHKISEWPRENENRESIMPQINGNIVNLKK
ncbi:MAG: hypothetical protein ABIG88_02985 [Patescibacteria group bacterium]|nr:hypothetical protein [Patescibacteria group bacterium]